MEGIVGENGTVETLNSRSPSSNPHSPPTVVVTTNNGQPHLVVATANNIVQLSVPTSLSTSAVTTNNHINDVNNTQVQSVIQPNQQSVIQTAANLNVLSKGNVILVSKPNSVIQTTQGNISGLQTLEVRPHYKVVETGNTSDESYSDGESPKKRRDLLTRRPSYRKILNDLGGGEITEPKIEQNSSEGDSELSSHSISYHAVLPGTAIQLSSGEGGQGIHTLTMTNSSTGGAIVQYAQGQEFFVPVVTQGNLGGNAMEDQVRRREMRLLKNREAARECRRKKKEYIKCLENRVAVLENQNKALIDELKSLKELYCQQKTE